MAANKSTARRASGPRVHVVPADESNRGRVLEFLASVSLFEGTVFNREVYRGRAVLDWFVSKLEFNEPDAIQATPQECADVLAYLSNVQAAGKHNCFGHSGGGASCGYSVILDWVADQLRTKVRFQ